MQLIHKTWTWNLALHLILLQKSKEQINVRTRDRHQWLQEDHRPLVTGHRIQAWQQEDLSTEDDYRMTLALYQLKFTVSTYRGIYTRWLTVLAGWLVWWVIWYIFLCMSRTWAWQLMILRRRPLYWMILTGSMSWTWAWQLLIPRRPLDYLYNYNVNIDWIFV